MNRIERAILYIFAILLIVSTLGLLSRVNSAISTTVPAAGGTHTEGIVGFPRFINPVLASSDADKSLTELVYAGLMRTNEAGELVPALAESYSISENGTVYTFRIREDATFHDGHPVTAEDVVFTVRKIQEGNLRSPQQSNWDGVQVTQSKERVVEFTLEEPYSYFLENTTLGILPKHRWDESADTQQFTFSRLNTHPVGAGPYEVTHVNENSAGVPQSYTLKAFDNYVGGEPFITTVKTQFFSNASTLIRAYRNNNIDAIAGINTKKAAALQNDSHRIRTAPLPRVFGIFFNQNQTPLFTNQTIRKALNTAVDREKIIAEALHGFGTRIHGPLPPTTGVDATSTKKTDDTDTQSHIRQAQQILRNDGWTRNKNGVFIRNTDDSTTELSFSIITANTPELRATATSVKRMWERMGADVNIELFESGNLNQDVIRPREYGALLFGQDIGRQQDLYPFWHSSKRNDPGLNVATYANITVDNLLEDIRSTNNSKERKKMLHDVQQKIMRDIPAVFLYSPDFIYALPRKKLHGVDIGSITASEERFADIHTWYTQTDSVWRMFVDDVSR
jgi:peptide/nickel transport system substrate-binding protein